VIGFEGEPITAKTIIVDMLEIELGAAVAKAY